MTHSLDCPPSERKHSTVVDLAAALAHRHAAPVVGRKRASEVVGISFMSKARIEIFSDGVFAIAITLLVLAFALPELRVPPAEGELAHALLRLWPNLVAYALSFSVIGLMWHNHQALLRLVERVDRTTVLLNLLLLGVVVFIPFATSVLGSYPTLRPAAFLYGLTLTASGITFNLLLGYLVRSAAFDPRIQASAVHQTIVSYRIGVATYAIATLTAFVAPLLSFALYLLIVAFFLFPRGVDTDLVAQPLTRAQSHPLGPSRVRFLRLAGISIRRGSDSKHQR